MGNSAFKMFQTTHATFVVGKVKPEAFGLRADEPLPRTACIATHKKIRVLLVSLLYGFD